MAKVQISNVNVLANPAAFTDPFQFEVTIECIDDLPNGKLQEPTNISKQPIRTRYLGHVTGYQPIRAAFSDPFQFEVTIECIYDLPNGKFS